MPYLLFGAMQRLIPFIYSITSPITFIISSPGTVS